jgi:hypothetical protein
VFLTVGQADPSCDGAADVDKSVFLQSFVSTRTLTALKKDHGKVKFQSIVLENHTRALKHWSPAPEKGGGGTELGKATKVLSKALKNETISSVRVDADYANARWRSLAVWLSYSIAAAAFAWWKARMEQTHTHMHTNPSASSAKFEQVRENHWDVAKAFFMLLVVLDHMGLPDPIVYSMIFRFEMPGFSLASGVMAASSVYQLPSSKVSELRN